MCWNPLFSFPGAVPFPDVLFLHDTTTAKCQPGVVAFWRIWYHRKMASRMRIVLLLLVGLGILTWIADHLLTSSQRAWYLKDVSARARLAVSSGRIALESRLRYGDSTDLEVLLRDFTRDERVMAVALCDDSGALRQASPLFPEDWSCPSLVRRWRDGLATDSVWESRAEGPAGPVLLTVHMLGAARDTAGWVALVQDLSPMERRGARTSVMILGLFGGLALAASVLTFLAVGFVRKGWLRDLRRAMRDERAGDEFRPLLDDMRELVDELATERGADDRNEGWTAERLKSVLREQLHWERIVVLANREPYIHDRTESGEVRVRHPASGLVTALEPLLRACSGTWVAHGSGTADRENVDTFDRVAVPPEDPRYQLRRVWLSEQEEDGFYYGFSNEGLWPLCHIAHARPHFRTEDWNQYRSVNERFAEAVCAEATSDDPVVLVQDYHFALAPRMIRERLPKATILTFWHIPWPNVERFGICPWREEILDGLLGSSIVGFHTRQHCNNFLESVDKHLEARIDREIDGVVRGGVTSLVRPYPISIAWPDPWCAQQPPVAECRRQVLSDLGLPSDVRLGVGVDRLDYTKGIEERLLAVDELLRTRPEYRGKFTFVQIGAPSRSRIPQYQRLADAVVETAEEINRRWADGVWRPVVLLKEHHETPDIYRHYRAADVCYVSSLHDGMNLVAKEYVAARDDEGGSLVLSQFAGAAKELTEALIVNPYDLAQAAAALDVALRMPEAERRERMRSMRRMIAQRNVYRWAGRMLLDAAQLRRRQKLEGRIHVIRERSGVDR